MEVLVSSTGGERRCADAPEYCMTGSGWRIKERGARSLTLPSGPVEAALMTLERAGYADRQLAFWFADGEQTLATFTRLLGTDAARCLRGEITDWYVFRLIAPDQESLTAFARELQFTFRPVGELPCAAPPLGGRAASKCCVFKWFEQMGSRHLAAPDPELLHARASSPGSTSDFSKSAVPAVASYLDHAVWSSRQAAVGADATAAWCNPVR